MLEMRFKVLAVKLKRSQIKSIQIAYQVAHENLFPDCSFDAWLKTKHGVIGITDKDTEIYVELY